jgi:iron complex transport system permease protein
VAAVVDGNPTPPAASVRSGTALLRRTTALRAVGLGVAVVGLVLACLASVAFGARPIPLRTVADALLHYDPSVSDHLVVRTLRVPRTIIGLLVGAALGLAGTVMQGVTRNPLADPGILGVQAGSALFVVIAIHSFGVTSLVGFVWFAFLGAAFSTALVYALGSAGRGGATPVKLALAGSAVTAFLLSITTAILLLDVATLDQYRFWAVGSLAGRDATIARQVAPFILVGIVLALASGRLLNAMALGDDVARSLGQRLGATRAFCMLCIVVLCGGATAAAGPVAFVGLTVPHMARAITGPDHRWVLPYSMVLAPTLLLTSDVIGRVVARPGELQVGIVTAIVGSPFFVLLVRRRKLASL